MFRSWYPDWSSLKRIHLLVLFLGNDVITVAIIVNVQDWCNTKWFHVRWRWLRCLLWFLARSTQHRCPVANGNSDKRTHFVFAQVFSSQGGVSDGKVGSSKETTALIKSMKSERLVRGWVARLSELRAALSHFIYSTVLFILGNSLSHACSMSNSYGTFVLNDLQAFLMRL